MQSQPLHNLEVHHLALKQVLNPLRHWPPNPHALYGVFGHQVVEAVVTAKREEPPRNEALKWWRGLSW